MDGNKHYSILWDTVALIQFKEIFNIRVTYFVDDVSHTVNIIRVRSNRQEPLTY